MNYSDDASMVRVDFFKSSGKWYTTEAVKWTGAFYGAKSERSGNQPVALIHDAFAETLRNHLGDRLRGFDAVCLEPYHEHTHPIMLKAGSWIV